MYRYGSMRTWTSALPVRIHAHGNELPSLERQRVGKIALPNIPLAISFVTAMKNKREKSQHASADFKAELEKALSDFQIPALSAAQKERLYRHYEMLLNWNRHTNLTRIVSPAEAARLHYAESVFSERFITDAKTVLDIGSGAGFPAV